MHSALRQAREKQKPCRTRSLDVLKVLNKRTIRNKPLGNLTGYILLKQKYFFPGKNSAKTRLESFTERTPSQKLWCFTVFWKSVHQCLKPTKTFADLDENKSKILSFSIVSERFQPILRQKYSQVCWYTSLPACLQRLSSPMGQINQGVGKP